MTKKKEKLLHETHKKYFQLIMGDLSLEQIYEIIADDVSGYGTTMDEKILEIGRLRKMIIDQRKQGEGIEISFDVKPVNLRVSPDKDMAIFNDEVKIVMQDGDEENVINLRLSTVYEFLGDKWKVVHLHRSTAVETEDDTWHLNEWKRKSEELQKLVDEKTDDLANKNRELEIEAALERIRAIAMSMQKAEGLLDVVEILSTELKKLGFKDIRNTIINIFNDSEEKFLNYDYSDYGVGGISEVDYNSHPSNKEFVNKMRKASNEFMITEFTGNELDEWRKWRIDQGQMPDPKLDQAKSLYYYEFSIGVGSIGISTFSPINADQLKIFNKIRNVFDLAYRRYTDIAQAEAHAREAQIEASLERVRSKTMAMHNSHDMGITVETLFEQVLKLGLDNDIRCGIGILEGKERMETRSATLGPNGEVDFKMGMLDMTIHPMLKRIKKAWKSGGTHFADQMTGKDVIRYYTALNNEPDYPFHVDLDTLPKKQFHNSFSFSEGILFAFSPNPMSEEAAKVMDRFARVFGQTYRRFVDLQKAEAQAREAQIEAALERVRSKAMAMHSSEDLGLTVDTFFAELKGLNVSPHRCGLGIIDKETKIVNVQAIDTNGGKHIKKVVGDLKLSGHPVLDKIFENWELQKEYFPVLRGKEIMDYYNVMNPQVKFHEFADDEVQYGYYFYFKEGGVYAWTDSELPERDLQIFRRYSSVLSLTYRRYLDLKEAEAQAREAKIEASLERIRSRALSMQKSTEVGEVNDLLFEEFEKMGIEMVGCGISVINEETDYCEQWRASQVAAVNSFEPYSYKESVSILSKYVPGFMRKFQRAWKKGDSFLNRYIKGKERDAYIDAVSAIFKYNKNQRKEILASFPGSFMANFIFYKRGWLSLSTIKPLTEYEINFSRRFVEAFDFAHTRFLDLKQAEEQAREAQIEAALEKVRGQSMAMHKSEQLPETAKVLFEQFKSLGKIPDRIGIVVIKEEVKEVELWATDQIGSQLKDRFRGSLDGASSMVQLHKAWKEGKESIVIDLTGQELKDWMRYTREEMKLVVDDTNMKGRRVQQAAFFSHGFLIFTSNEPVADEIMKLLVRFAKVFDQAYIRFLDLQKAEAQAKEAIKQSSLDRVRGQIASMRSTDDLQRITPLVWRELETLEVPFNRCGVFIVDEPASQVRVYLTTPDGKPLGVLNLPIDINELTRKTVKNWRKKTVYIQHWNKNDFIDWMKSMIELGQVKSEQEYQGNVAPPESLDLHFIPFTQGMLYVGNNQPLSEDKIDLVKSLAKAFSVAYARYEDFKHLEEAKNEIENTFNDLKATQNQLIQAEKMASLGELTAGIAHEIQNPLNFVNNFSEVNAELIEELKEEIENKEWEEVKAIANDISGNEEKIKHHGKRADDIVKGMLQHSRTSTNEKEPTDINLLADEYLRLSYHGLRAKDKSFNADFKANLDDSLPKIKVIPQDIGRVLLNLINNAFYACSERSRSAASSKTSASEDKDYKPQVIVTTKKLDNNIQITVKDNGIGIPAEMSEKIFQPFFTTKPTGEGTGLGLSLSYDIITKGHGGELKVETKKNEGLPADQSGTEFIIQIPINE